MSTPEVPAPASSSLARTTTRPASTASTTPPRSATTAVPESLATVRSMPVPTSGLSARSVGTAWRCMFEPIRARLASSCSRNGISEAATDTIWRGDTSMYCTWSGVVMVNSLPWRHEIRSSLRLPSAPSRVLACAITYSGSSSADM